MNKQVKGFNVYMLGEYTSILQNWALAHPRPMPWKGISDPYRIWLSEIILQQTRVEQGLPYYERFVAAYPTISDLAAAPLDDIYKLWEGLGYYSRARNMYAAAQSVLHEHHGVFPTQYKDIKALKALAIIPQQRLLRLRITCLMPCWMAMCIGYCRAGLAWIHLLIVLKANRYLAN